MLYIIVVWSCSIIRLLLCIVKFSRMTAEYMFRIKQCIFKKTPTRKHVIINQSIACAKFALFYKSYKNFLLFNLASNVLRVWYIWNLLYKNACLSCGETFYHDLRVSCNPNKQKIINITLLQRYSVTWNVVKYTGWNVVINVIMNKLWPI